MTKTQSRVAVVATVAVGIIATGVLYATIPDAEGVIHACYARSGGTIRVIDDSVTQCKQGETSLAWNVKGVQGLPGIQGPPGPKGDTGDSQVFTVGTTEIGATESLAVPDLGTVTANCSGGRSLAQVDGAIPFDTTVVHNDGSASFCTTTPLGLTQSNTPRRCGSTMPWRNGVWSTSRSTIPLATPSVGLR